MNFKNVDSAKVPWIGPAKYKIENLPDGLFNTRERTHLRLTFIECISLLMIVMKIDIKEVSNFSGIDLKDLKNLSSELKNLEKRFNDKIHEHNFDKKGCFVKLSGASSKDIVIKPVHNFNEFLKIIIGSGRITKELHKAIYGNCSQVASPLLLPLITEEGYDPVSIIMSEWVNTERFIEFRTFVIDGEPCFISQSNLWEYFPQIEKDPNCVVRNIGEIIGDYKSRNWLIDPNLVADFWLDENLRDPKFIEYNPYQLSDPCLFRDSIFRNSEYPIVPIERYRNLQGCFRFIGRTDNGLESIPLDALLTEKQREMDIEEIERKMKVATENNIDSAIILEMRLVLTIKKLDKIKTMGISQSRFKL